MKRKIELNDFTSMKLCACARVCVCVCVYVKFILRVDSFDDEVSRCVLEV